MARTYVELHPLGESVISRIGAPISRDDNRTPVFAGNIQVLETTDRTDGPFTPGKLYNAQTDTILPAPPPKGLSKAQELKLIDPTSATTANIFEALQQLL